MSTRVTIVAVIAAIWFLLVVLELVRRRRVGERYALLWLFTCVVVLFFAAWPAALDRFASAVGIAYAPTALFVLAGGFVLLVLLHYATVISALTDKNIRLAQRVAILEERLAHVEETAAAPREPGGLPVPHHAPGDEAEAPRRTTAEPVER
jgi:hypothetical protein